MSLQIINLQAENFKRLVAINITPDGNVVVLSGANRQGKTSVLDAILAVLKGSKFSRETSQTIRDGQDHAWVRLEIGTDAQNIEYIATRRWTKNDAGTLTVESTDGAKYSSPQALLDKIVGEISFDALAFIEMKAAEQVGALVKALGPSLPFDPDVLERERSGVFDQRSEINRAVKQLEGQLTGLTKPNDETPTVEVSAGDIIAEFEKARAHNERHTMLGYAATNAEVARDEAESEVTQLVAALDAARAELVRAQERATDARAAHTTFEPIDTDSISARLAGVEKTNAAIREGQEWRRVANELGKKKEESAQFTVALAKIDKTKADGIAAASFPVPELSFDNNGVTYNGRAFTQASTEEQMRASFGVAIAANPELRVCRIDKGEALDSASLRILGQLAAEHNMQVWISRVDESGSIGFVIEEGEVRS